MHSQSGHISVNYVTFARYKLFLCHDSLKNVASVDAYNL